MPGPIKPSEVVKKKTAQIPEIVFEVANELIAENWTGSSATFTVDELAERVVARGTPPADTPVNYRAALFAKRAFDIEDSYREAGWTVKFDRPGYNESYSANWTFTKGRTR